MERFELIQGLQALDRRISVPVDLVIVGGAAMVLHFGSNRATADIDCIPQGSDFPILARAAQTVADELSLPPDWLSDAVKGYEWVLGPDYRRDLVPLAIDTVNLRVWVLSLADQVLLKIIALRERDLEDLEVLAQSLGKDDFVHIANAAVRIEPRRADWAMRIGYFMEEQGWTS